VSRPLEEGADPAQHRLHNCGPSSREVFRTPAIGRVLTFDLHQARQAWQREEVFRQIVRESAAAGGTPASLYTCVIGLALREFGVEIPLGREEDLRSQTVRALGVLVRTLVERGLVDDLAGIAAHHRREPGEPEPLAACPSMLEIARTLAVYAVYTPPLVLWTRTPSMRWMRHDTLITLRRFGAPQPAPAAAGGAA
jgi:hypothetical protein